MKKYPGFDEHFVGDVERELEFDPRNTPEAEIDNNDSIL